jgi:hypothetical protein
MQFNESTEALLAKTIRMYRISKELANLIRRLMSIAYSEGRVSVREERIKELEAKA